MKVQLFWNEIHNILAVADLSHDLPWFYIVEEDYTDDNPIMMYPRSFLDRYGWICLGDFK